MKDWHDSISTYYNTYLRQCDIGKRSNRSMKQNSQKNRPTQIHLTDLWQRRKSDTMAKEIFSSVYGAETGHPHAGVKKKTNLDTDLTLFTKWTKNETKS